MTDDAEAFRAKLRDMRETGSVPGLNKRRDHGYRPIVSEETGRKVGTHRIREDHHPQGAGLDATVRPDTIRKSIKLGDANGK
jgi:hypothetical protein